MFTPNVLPNKHNMTRCDQEKKSVSLTVNYTSEFHTRTAQSSRVGCSQRVHRIVYVAVKMVLFWSIFFSSENVFR